MKNKPKPQAVADLENAIHAQRMAARKNLSEHVESTAFSMADYVPKPKLNDTTANGLTRCILLFIRLKGGQAERISITGRPIETPIGIKWGVSHMTKGTADISATIQGRSVKIEVKAGRDIQSVEQRAYQSSIEAAGGLYYVARNFTDFVAWYKLKFGGLNDERW